MKASNPYETIKFNKEKYVENNTFFKVKQAENYKFEGRRLNIWRESVARRNYIKDTLSTVSVNALIKKKKEKILDGECNQAHLIREGALNNLNEELKQECKDVKLIDSNPYKTNTENQQNEDSNESYGKNLNVPSSSTLEELSKYQKLRQKFSNLELARKTNQIRILEETINQGLDRAYLSIDKYSTIN